MVTFNDLVWSGGKLGCLEQVPEAEVRGRGTVYPEGHGEPNRFVRVLTNRHVVLRVERRQDRKSVV